MNLESVSEDARGQQVNSTVPAPLPPEELPVFWACGVTPQAVVMKAKPPFCITHAPGYMLVTDVRNTALSLG